MKIRAENDAELKILIQEEEGFKAKDIKINELKLYADKLKTQNEKIEKLKTEVENSDDILTKIKEKSSYEVRIGLLNQKEEKIINLKSVLQEHTKLNEEYNKINDEKQKVSEIEKFQSVKDNLEAQITTLKNEINKKKERLKNITKY